ncbi:acylneuraminate cytidylyltransferase family protein [Xanthomonas cannabis]|uniref:acylneuraminate cytidylyltransferase family protein n=1 Tax=Xanthomonas cannabis TaxID=1885674 RepID=UPI0033A0BF92
MSGRIVAVVPARGGSKGIARKNLVPLGGRPLLAWTITAALESGVVDQVVVSTDDLEIGETARRFGAETPFVRPPELAGDDVHAVQVVLHALRWLEEHQQCAPQGVMMLLPTSPLRSAEDVRQVVQLFDRQRAEAVISVADLGKYMTNLRYLDQERLEMVDPAQNRNAQRQGLRKLYGVNGSLFLARPDALRRAGTFHIEGALGYVMDSLRSVDINSQADLVLARRLLAAWPAPNGDIVP